MKAFLKICSSFYYVFVYLHPFKFEYKFKILRLIYKPTSPLLSQKKCPKILGLYMEMYSNISDLKIIVEFVTNIP